MCLANRYLYVSTQMESFVLLIVENYINKTILTRMNEDVRVRSKREAGLE